jgi:biopolymer transport protein ExbD
MLLFEEEKSRRPHIEIIPMIDVMMFLLVFFVMISLNVIPVAGLKTQLPQAKTAQTLDPTKHVVITIAATGEVELDGKALALPDLLVHLRKEHQANPNLNVVLNGDKSATVEDLVKVMDVVRGIGIERVAIATRKQAEAPQ